MDNCKKIVEKIDHEEANKYLDLGWTLIETYKTSYEPGHQEIHYVLAWTKETDPTYPKLRIYGEDEEERF